MDQDKPALHINPAEPQPGEILAGKYELRRVVGRGGFGLVYDALHLGIGRQVALKVLLPEWATQDPELAIRFRREAVLSSQLRHPNTITIYDYGQTGSNILFMAMEFVEGRTLSSVLRNESPISARRVVHILEQILASLQEAHGRGIIHRDLKPGNIMITSHKGDTEFVKVLDFGIAKAISRDLLRGEQVGQTLTQVGQFCGTPRYMAPEQFRNGKVTPACDLYSVGLISYELLTGKPAIVGTTMVDLIVNQVTGPDLVLPSSLGLPLGLCDTIHKALRKDPEQRFSDALTFAAELEYWQQGQTNDRPIPALTAEDTSQTRPVSTVNASAVTSVVVSPEALLQDTGQSSPILDPDFLDPEPTPLRPPVGFSPLFQFEELEDTDDSEPETGPQPVISTFESVSINSEGPDPETTNLLLNRLTSTSDTTDELTQEVLASSLAVLPNSDFEPTIDISRREVFRSAELSPSRVAARQPDVDATVDMPIDFEMVKRDLEHAKKARISPDVRRRQELRQSSTEPRSSAAPSEVSVSNWHIRAVYTVGMLIIIILGGLIIIQASRFAWDNGLSTRLGSDTAPSPHRSEKVVMLDETPTDPVTITVKSLPPGAEVYVDEKRKGLTPVMLTASRGRNARLQVKLKKHIGYATELRFRSNRILEVNLTPARKAP